MQKIKDQITEPLKHTGTPRPAISQLLPKWFSVLRQGDVAFVSIHDDIGAFNNSASELIAEIGDASSVEFIINSSGGDGNTAFKVHDSLKGKVTQATINGECSSAAWVFALTAKRILMASNAKGLVHTCVDVVIGTEDVLEMAARNLRKINTRLRNLFAQRTKMPDSLLSSLLDGNDHMLTPEQCKGYGMVDEIFVPHTPKVLPTQLQPASEAGAAKGPTEKENLFNSFLVALGTVDVRNRQEFGKQLSEWFNVKVREI